MKNWKVIILIAAALVSFNALNAQGKYMTKTGRITFVSQAPLEDIEAKNKSVLAAIDSKTGAIQFSVTMKGFEFEKSTMQEHFNEKYVESDKYPKAAFTGTIINNNAIDYNKPGTYNAVVKGKLTIHGVTKDITSKGTVKVTGNGLDVASGFKVAVADYKISIPAAVKNKVAKTVQVNVEAKLDPVK